MAGVVTETIGRVGVLTLDEPDSLNAMTPDLLNALKQAVDDVSHQSGIRALVLTGAGRGFCSGQNLKAFQSLGPDLVAV